LQLSSFGGYGLALAALALVAFGAYDSNPRILRSVLGNPHEGSYSILKASRHTTKHMQRAHVKIFTTEVDFSRTDKERLSTATALLISSFARKKYGKFRGHH